MTVTADQVFALHPNIEVVIHRTVRKILSRELRPKSERELPDPQTLFLLDSRREGLTEAQQQVIVSTGRKESLITGYSRFIDRVVAEA